MCKVVLVSFEEGIMKGIRIANPVPGGIGVTGVGFWIGGYINVSQVAIWGRLGISSNGSIIGSAKFGLANTVNKFSPLNVAQRGCLVLGVH